MIKLDDIPREVRQERNEKCRKCTTRKYYAKMFDMHFDWVDCPYDCENDFEHLQKELVVEEHICGTCKFAYGKNLPTYDVICENKNKFSVPTVVDKYNKACEMWR